MVGEGLEPGSARGGLQDPESLALEVHADEVGDVRLVVDDDDRSPFHMPDILTGSHVQRVDGPCDGFVMRRPAGGETTQGGRVVPRYAEGGGPPYFRSWRLGSRRAARATARFAAARRS